MNRGNKKALKSLILSAFMLFGFSPSTRGGNRTRTPLPELDFESSASTYSATRAFPFTEIGVQN